jgi:methionyl-tRNA synthetase
MLLAAGLEPAHTVFGHGFLLTKGEKMSKSKGNALSPQDMVRVFGVDAYRYYFMSDVQFGHDGSISMERMVQVYNNELANTWGNLCSRVLNMTKKYFGAQVPAEPSATTDPVARELLDQNPLRAIAEGLYAKYDACMAEVDFTGAVSAVQELAQAANLYIEEKAPFRLAKDPEAADQLAAVMYNLLESIRIGGILLKPYLPETAEKILVSLNTDKNTFDDLDTFGLLETGTNVTDRPEILFQRLDEKIVSDRVDDIKKNVPISATGIAMIGIMVERKS